MNKSAVIILFLILIGGGYFAYTSFSGGTSTADMAAATDATDGAGTQLIALLAQLQGLKMNGAIFDSPQFASLRDETTPVLSEPIGRSNPFAPIGHDSGFSPTTGSITSVQTGTSSVSNSGSKPAGTVKAAH
jgi:hypothetical protein